MSSEATRWALEQKHLKASVQLLLVHMGWRHFKDDDVCIISQEQLAEKCGISRRTVNRHLDELVERGLIQRIAGSRVGDCTRYRLLLSTADLGVEEAVAHAVSERTERVPKDDPAPDHRVPNAEGTVCQPSGTHNVFQERYPPDSPIPYFSQLLAVWDRDEIGDQNKAARYFRRLSPADRQLAIRNASIVRTAYWKTKRNGNRPHTLADYLRNGDFRQFDEELPLDADGHMRVTPQRPEWAAWIKHTTDLHGPQVADRALKQAYLLVSTRWPPGHFRNYGHGGRQ